MPVSWQISDLIDLDFFLRRDENPDIPGAGAADRAIYLTYADTHSPPFDRKALIRRWLDAKRAAAPETHSLPGTLYNEAFGILKITCAGAAFLIGALLAWSVLSYSGTAPINVFTCLWVLVAPQLLLLVLLGISGLLSRLGMPGAFAGFYPAAGLLLRRLTVRAQKSGKNALSAAARLRVNALAEAAARGSALYGPVFFWPVFILAQIFGVWFNLGLLLAAGLKLAITDLAFGWQSTLFFDPATVYRMVEVFSSPWSWALNAAHPTLAQVEGSRMVLKEGMVHLATPDLVSWWPFLLYAVLCYGLAPRLALLAWGYWRQRRTLGAVSFSTGDSDRLISRMQTPSLQSKGLKTENGPTASTSPIPATKAGPAGEPGGPAGHALVLVAEEVADFFPDREMETRVRDTLGLDMAGRLSVEQDPEADARTLADFLSRYTGPPENLRVVVVAEAWQPPLAETLFWLSALRRAMGPRTGLIVGLVGKPEPENPFTAPDDMDFRVWTQATAGLKDPFMRTERLGGGHG
ncbi:DUF2868 domain-containing protein [Desulfosudis oleivorans]|uniref:DUF2868 domain-containing protein n=1 Tax=Desulfosudis oleivorans (strain DSM 6200 / JCM 39069 / Hxd3) TaxID=96561 RepID=A8ZZA0_DESOH|nr:DUF2868 domain-containing protein [Desulfosudis oleivorans]ABW67253.1 hypothetical protein Dole_1449 [Desulfosudis oleivorans Hxd3]